MRDRNVIWLGLALLLGVTLACNAYAPPGEPELPPPPLPVVTILPGTVASGVVAPGTPATPDVAPTATLMGEATIPPAQGTLRILADLNVRAGPGVEYERVGFLLRDETAVILGQDAASGWWKIACPPRAEGDECWVSGSARYTQAEAGVAAPTVIAPPSPTPAPPDPAPGTGLLVYVDGGRLFATTLDLSSEPPLAAPPTQLSDAASVQRVAIAPDGRTIAFTALDPTTGHNEMRLVNADGGNERVLARSADLPRVPEATELPAAANDDARVQVLEFQWRTDGAGLLFNTALINLDGYSAGSQSDLWAVDLLGPVTERLAAGRGLPRFAGGPGGQVLLVGRQEILRLNPDGALETVLTFEALSLSDRFYYPAVQWGGDGAFALTAVAEPRGADGSDAPADRRATLWRIPVAGAAERLGRLRADALAAPPLWSDSGGQVAYLRSLAQGQELWLADGDGARPERVAEGEAVRALAWQAAGGLLYAGGDTAAVRDGAGQSTVISLGSAERPGRGVWLGATSFVLESIAFDGFTTLRAFGGEGQSADLARVSGSGVTFDVWLP